jgi:hypothetical protein
VRLRQGGRKRKSIRDGLRVSGFLIPRTGGGRDERLRQNSLTLRSGFVWVGRSSVTTRADGFRAFPPRNRQRAVVGPLRRAHSSRAHEITESRLSAWIVGGVWSTLPALAFGYRTLSNSSEMAQTPWVCRRTWVVPPSTSIVRETEASGGTGTGQMLSRLPGCTILSQRALKRSPGAWCEAQRGSNVRPRVDHGARVGQNRAERLYGTAVRLKPESPLVRRTRASPGRRTYTALIRTLFPGGV